jgi:bisphosphoglycerate-independent phosphoglycerate mutase (AlkP superfamily)
MQKFIFVDRQTPYYHTISEVPFIVVGQDCELKESGTLADIARQFKIYISSSLSS